jgi:hypothetical protein
MFTTSLTKGIHMQHGATVVRGAEDSTGAADALFGDATWTTLPDYVAPAKRLCLHNGITIPEARNFVALGTEFPCVVTPSAPFKSCPIHEGTTSGSGNQVTTPARTTQPVEKRGPSSCRAPSVQLGRSQPTSVCRTPSSHRAQDRLDYFIPAAKKRPRKRRCCDQA